MYLSSLLTTLTPYYKNEALAFVNSEKHLLNGGVNSESYLWYLLW